MTFISNSISMKTSNIIKNKSHVFERSDCTITVHNHRSAPPLILGGDLNISDQNNWGAPEQKIKFGVELNFRGAYEHSW